MVKTMLRTALLTLLGAFLGLLLAEWLLRIFWHPAFLDPKNRRDDLAWMSKNVVLNNFGYRNPDVSPERKNRPRIYSLGDSYTFGWYISDSELTYPRLLERMFEGRAEVINAAKPGFNLEHSVDRFLQEGVLFSPDVVTLGINVFDLLGREFAPPPSKTKILEGLKLYQLTIGNAKRARLAKLTEQEITRSSEANSEQAQKTNQLISNLAANARSINASLVLVVFPNYDSAFPNQQYRYKKFHDLIAQIGKEANVTVVDLLGAFEAIPDKNQLILNATDAHPSVLAHEIVAKTLYATLGPSMPVNIIRPQRKIRKVGISDTLPQLHGIEEILPEGEWVYFRREKGLGAQKSVITKTEDRKIAYMVDYLATAQSSTHQGWPGAKIEKSEPGGTNTIVLEREVYGYSVAGISQVTVFWKEDGALKSRDLETNELEILKEIGNIKINILAPQKFEFYRINIDVSVKQIDIEKEKVVAASRTKTISGRIGKGSSQLNLENISPTSLPMFTANGESVGYVWYGNKQKGCKFYSTPNGIQVEFSTLAESDVEIEGSFAVEFNPTHGEKSTIIYL